MTFYSILIEEPGHAQAIESPEAPAYFTDLNLDQIVDAITASKAEYDLKPFYYSSLTSVSAIQYRHEVFRELENEVLLNSIKNFAQKMHNIRDYLARAKKTYYILQKEKWFLDAVSIYCTAIIQLRDDLAEINLISRGFLAFRDYLTNYTKSEHFIHLQAENGKIKNDLASIQYCLLIRGNSIRVRKYEDEIDYSVVVDRTFEKFKQGAVKDYQITFPNWLEMNHVEEKILGYVSQLFPETFADLENFCKQYSEFQDTAIGNFDREIQFYIAYMEFIHKLKTAGLKFCYPKISSNHKDIQSSESFDVALANKLVNDKMPTICNDFYLNGEERIIVVTGPNQGGKTTFARAFGQIHHLASIGVPVPGRKAKLFLFDHIFTHFEKEETIKNQRGKLEDDLIRIHKILEQATAKSIIIMNEIFNSTTIQDAVYLGKEILEKILRIDALGICVTFIDELSSLNEKTVSMVSTVMPDNPTLRTFRIIRKPADGLSYAISIADKYHLTYASLKERIES